MKIVMLDKKHWEMTVIYQNFRKWANLLLMMKPIKTIRLKE